MSRQITLTIPDELRIGQAVSVELSKKILSAGRPPIDAYIGLELFYIPDDELLKLLEGKK